MAATASSSQLVSMRPGLRSAIAAAALAALSVSQGAWAQTTTFTGSGTVQPTADVPAPGTLNLLAQGSYEFAGFGTWDLISGFVFDTTLGIGGGSFQFSQGGDSFSGLLSTTLAPIAGGVGFEASYQVTSGTGALTGIVGSANSVIRITGDLAGSPPWAYLEAGIVSVVIPAIPEPATGLLMLGGVAALLARRWRRD